MRKFSQYLILEQEGKKKETDPELQKALDALKDYPEDQRAGLEQQIRQAYEQQKALTPTVAPVSTPAEDNRDIVTKGADLLARGLGIQAGPAPTPGRDVYKEQEDTPEKAERHNQARDFFYSDRLSTVENQRKLRQLLGQGMLRTGDAVTIDDIKNAGLDPDEVWKSISPGTYYANAPLDQQMQAASAGGFGSREARMALGGLAGAWEMMQDVQAGLPGLAAGGAAAARGLGRAPAPAPTPAQKPTEAPRAPGAPPPAREAGGRVVGPGTGSVPASAGKAPSTPGIGAKVATALTAITIALNAINAPARAVTPTPQQGIVQTTPGAGTPTTGTPTPTPTPARPAAPAPAPTPAAAPKAPTQTGGGAAPTTGAARTPAPSIAPSAPMAPAPAPTPTQEKPSAEAPREVSPVPQKGINIGDVVPAIGMVQAAKDAVQKSIDDTKKDATGQEAPSKTEDKTEDKAKEEAEAKAKAEAEAKAKAETPQKADQWWKDQATVQAPSEAPAQAPAQQPARVPSPAQQPTKGETPGRITPGKVTPPTPRQPTPPPVVPPPFSPAPKKKQPEKEEPSPSGGSGVGQMFISGLATTTKEAEPIVKSFTRMRKESLSPEVLVQRARLSMIHEALYSLIERQDEEEDEEMPAEDEDSCGDSEPMAGNAGMFVSAQEQPPEPEVKQIRFKRSRA